MNTRRRFTVLVAACAGALVLVDSSSGIDSARADQTTVQMDDSAVEAVYANACRITAGPDELFLCFGLISDDSAKSVQSTQRIAMNYFTTKRMVAALKLTIARHEATFGEVKLDSDKVEGTLADSSRGLPRR